MNKCFCRFGPAAVLVGALLCGGVRLDAGDVSLYEVRKGIRYDQTNSAAPIIPFDNGYSFSADVFPVVTNWVTGASVESPNTYAYLPLEFTGTRYQWQRSESVLAVMDIEYANGVYQLIVNALHDGNRYFRMPLQGSAYPNGPHVTDFGLLQKANANGYSMLTWDWFNGGTSTDLVRVTIEDAMGNQVYQTQNSHEQSALNGGINWAVIGPGRLSTNKTYTGKLLFQKNVWLDRTGYPGALGLAAYYCETRFPLQTTAARAPDVKTIELAKSSQWIQTSNDPPIPFELTNGFQFSASIRAYQTSVLTSATLLMPTNAQVHSNVLELQPDQVTLRVSRSPSTSEKLDAEFGTGPYTLSFNTPHDGLKTLTLTLQSVTNSPQAPQILNFDSVTRVRAFKPLTVSWVPWTNGTVADFIQLRIEDGTGTKVFETPDLGSPNALHGLTTNALVPAGTLGTGQRYNAKLVFRRKVTVNTVMYPDVFTLADYHSQTTFAIQTEPADVVSYDIIRAQLFAPNQTGDPIPLSANGYYFAAVVQALNPNTVSTISVTSPVGTNRTLTVKSAQTIWTFTNRVSTLSALNSSFPGGRYTLTGNGLNDGMHSLYATLPSGFPPAPRLTNYDPSALFNSETWFSILWDPFDVYGTNVSDFVQLRIMDEAGTAPVSTPDPGESGALSGGTTGTNVAPRTLLPNHFYSAELSFITLQKTNTPGYSQPPGRALSVSTTVFRIGTRGTGNPPSITVNSNPTNTQALQFTAQVVSNQTYRVEYATNIPFVWIPLLTNKPSSETFNFADPRPTRGSQTFYRILTW